MSLVRQSVSVSQNNLLCQCFMLFMLEDDKSVSAVCVLNHPSSEENYGV